jgi:hypothetical protein
MKTLEVQFSDETLERFRAAFKANQAIDEDPTDEELAQYLKVQASALTYDIEVRRSLNGNGEGWTF